MNRIESLLSKTKATKLLIPFFTAGYPTFDASLSYVRTAANSGANMIEIGIPFSDPLADGPEIQHASQIALEQGTSLKRILEGVTELRKTVNIPLILMGYFNPILAYGTAKFFADAKTSGVDGLIIPDLPIEEAEEIITLAKKADISLIFLVAPTTSPERIKLIDRATTGFVYAVTVTGVTGVTGRQKVFDQSTDTYLKRLQKTLRHPFMAGFGVNSPESAARLCQYSDGVVIGSALIKLIRETNGKANEAIGQFLRQIRQQIDE
jgi:tryptophan synthase alpha chain